MNSNTHRIPDWLEKALSSEQLRPFGRETPNASVLAGAGSGKTRTLVHLVAHDLLDGISPQNIIAFTFTEKAADELVARIYSLVKEHVPDIDLTSMYVGTIHAWCLQYLLEQQDFYGFEAIDELHLDALISRLYDYLQLEKIYGRPYPQAIGDFLADLEVVYNEHLLIEDIPNNIRPAVVAFLDILHSNRLITYGGMIRSAIQNLHQQGPLTHLRRLYVDEYQDVNPAQVELIRHMAPAECHVLAFGDDLQCIYQWRGSDVGRILSFNEDFEDSQIFRLESNYRARPQLVEFGNRAASFIIVRDSEKRMVPSRLVSIRQPINWLSEENEENQAERVADIVERLHTEGVPWNGMAILLRSVFGSGQPIVNALANRGIPVDCPILSRGGGFIDTFLLPTLDWLKRDHQEPKNEWEHHELEAYMHDLWETVQRWLSDKAGVEDRFWDGLYHWLDQVNAQTNEAYDVRGRLYDLLDYCGIRIIPEDNGLMIGLGIASQIIRSIEEIHRRRIAGQDRRTPKKILAEVYYALKRNQETFGESVPIGLVANGVLLTTVHQAKGLEWPVVILPMLMHRRFPVTNRGHGTSFSDAIASRYGTSIDDERRLFYVAVTRAKERLFLLDTASHASGTRSVFLQELQDTQALATPIQFNEIPSEVWKLLPEDMEEGAPHPVRVGLSDALLYVECPYHYGLSRHVGIQPSVSDELGYGKGLHELIQRRLESTEAWQEEELQREIEAHVHLPYMAEEGEQLSRVAVKDRLRRLEELDLFDAALESEVSVDVILGGGVISGIIDGIQRHENGNVTIRDWKANIHDELVARYERQLQFYARALELKGERVVSADLVDVGASYKQNTIIAREVKIEDSIIEQLFDDLECALKGIANQSFPPTPNRISCAACDMFRICEMRQADDQT